MEPQQQIADVGTAKLAWYDFPAEGEERGTILLLHGFASTARVNWIGTSWTKTLTEAGWRVIASDQRGHGNSQKFYEPEDYSPENFAADAMALLDFLNIERCPIMGYSMGARITSWICHAHPERVERAVFGGMGEHIFGGRGGYEKIAEALEADDPKASDDPAARSFRAFADRTGSDRLALAACVRPSEVKITPEVVGGIQTPVLIAVGTEDEIAGSPHTLAEMMPNATAFDIPGLDHMKATGAEPYKERVLAFLSE